MTQKDVMNELDIILAEAKTGVLATSDESGSPHMRWMTPTLLKDRQNTLYAITAESFDKAKHLSNNTAVEWMFQTAQLDRVLNLRGTINVLDNPSLRSEVLEAIGAKLTAFWKLKADETNLLVLETVIEEASFFKPMQGVQVRVDFTE